MDATININALVKLDCFAKTVPLAAARRLHGSWPTSPPTWPETWPRRFEGTSRGRGLQVRSDDGGQACQCGKVSLGKIGAA